MRLHLPKTPEGAFLPGIGPWWLYRLGRGVGCEASQTRWPAKPRNRFKRTPGQSSQPPQPDTSMAIRVRFATKTCLRGLTGCGAKHARPFPFSNTSCVGELQAHVESGTNLVGGRTTPHQKGLLHKLAVGQGSPGLARSLHRDAGESSPGPLYARPCHQQMSRTKFCIRHPLHGERGGVPRSLSQPLEREAPPSRWNESPGCRLREGLTILRRIILIILSTPFSSSSSTSSSSSSSS